MSEADQGKQSETRSASNPLGERRKRIALLVLLAIVGLGVYFVAPRIPRDIEVRINLVHMERGPGGELTVQTLEGLQVEIFLRGKRLHRVSVHAPTQEQPVAHFHVNLPRGRYQFLVTMRFRTAKGRVVDRLEQRVTIDEARVVTITP